MRVQRRMEILVCVKLILDTRLPVQVTEQGTVIQGEPWPVYVLNPADRAALEEAVRLRNEVGDCRITAITVGPARAGVALAYCVARGADNTVHLITDELVQMDSFYVARVLGAEIRKREFDLIMCGNNTEDNSSGEVGPFLAELLDLPQVTNVVKLNFGSRERKLVAERKLERGYRQLVETGLPALLTLDSSICQPRYVTVRAARYGAKRLAETGTIVRVQDSSLNSSGPSLRSVVSVSPPRPRPKKIAQPDAGMSPAERMAMLMSGAMPTKSSQRTTGGPESLADDMIAFLKEKGLLT